MIRNLSSVRSRSRLGFFQSSAASRCFKLGAIAITGTVALLICVSAVHNSGSDAGASLATVPILGVGAMLFLDADKGGGGGGSSKLPEAPPAPESGATLENQLSHWKKTCMDFFKQLGGAFKERDDELAAHGKTKDALKTEQDAHGKTKDALKAEQEAHNKTVDALSKANTTVAGLTIERDNARTDATRLEGLCDLRGIDHKKVVGAAPGAAVAPETAEDWNAKLAAAKTIEDQHQVIRDFQKAVKEGKVKKAA
jgi:hypothetical protein